MTFIMKATLRPQLFRYKLLIDSGMWLGAESNRRHEVENAAEC
jgi:hypothetical protein